LPANRQLHLSETGANICKRNRIMTRLWFLLRVTRRRLDLAAEIYHLREPRKIPLVMSPDETGRLLAVAGSLKARMLLSHGYGCGLRWRRGGQADKHIDHAQNIIRVEQSKGRRDRNVMLSAETLDLLQQRWKVRVMMPERRWRNAGHHRGASHLGLGADAEPSLRIPGIIISLIFNEQGKLVLRAAPLQN
jgi:integrase/recombinase XerD